MNNEDSGCNFLSILSSVKFFRERKAGVKLEFASRPGLMGGELRIFRLNVPLQMGTEINVRRSII
jgi:hypothetical protein